MSGQFESRCSASSIALCPVESARATSTTWPTYFASSAAGEAARRGRGSKITMRLGAPCVSRSSTCAVRLDDEELAVVRGLVAGGKHPQAGNVGAEHAILDPDRRIGERVHQAGAAGKAEHRQYRRLGEIGIDQQHFAVLLGRRSRARGWSRRRSCPRPAAASRSARAGRGAGSPSCCPSRADCNNLALHDAEFLEQRASPRPRARSGPVRAGARGRSCAARRRSAPHGRRGDRPLRHRYRFGRSDRFGS